MIKSGCSYNQLDALMPSSPDAAWSPPNELVVVRGLLISCWRYLQTPQPRCEAAIGWRIDYQVATDGLAARARSAVVERAATYGERWSDHAPVTVVYSD